MLRGSPRPGPFCIEKALTDDRQGFFRSLGLKPYFFRQEFQESIASAVKLATITMRCIHINCRTYAITRLNAI
jgi:hypothetical protein